VSEREAAAGGGPRVGDALEVVVEKGVYRGQGLARHRGQVVLVPRALPGDRMRVRVASTSRGFLQARTEELLAPGTDRRASPCPYVPRCGGCAYQELDYAAQLVLKQGILRESLQRAGAPWEGEIRVEASPEEGWRTRASLHFEAKGGALRVGLREEGSRRVVGIERCLQLSASLNRAALAIRDALADHRGEWPRISGLDLAEGGDGQTLVAALETGLAPREAPALGAAIGEAPWLTGFGVMVGPSHHRRYLGLRGTPYVRSTVLGLTLRSHVGSFFQGNRFLVEPLVRAVLEQVDPGGSVLDLYAGVGLFALPLAARGDSVKGVELNPLAVEDAEWNVRHAHLEGVRLEQGDVRAALGSSRAAGREHVILDPPRTGAGPEVIRAITERRPASIVYVSCDPPTLGRDLVTLREGGYRPVKVQAFDLFPDTFHLETVVRLIPS
jgi:23S rRNA (uracil1939-C5)-methyltransferase